ncbi:hypothetical protein KEM54_002260 [Ascosphaera aggregata]|nr:hypothetical protein KEM54_002260 [Ascosphaera aggregata]
MTSQIPRRGGQSQSSSLAQATAAAAVATAARRNEDITATASHSSYDYNSSSHQQQQERQGQLGQQEQQEQQEQFLDIGGLTYADLEGPFDPEVTITPFATSPPNFTTIATTPEFAAATTAASASSSKTGQLPAAEQLQAESTPPMPSSSSPIQIEDDEPRRCWICYSDETEDPVPKPEWRSPCPCRLTAHEACLLDWLADIENSSSRRRLRRGKLQCPQCKSEIVVRRPRNLVVELVRKADVLAGKMIAPGLALSLVSMVWAGCCMHGLYSFRAVFGSEVAHRMLMTGDGLLRRTRINIGLPLIPIILILSRTRYADRSLPVFPVLFFALQGNGVRNIDAQLWPPSPSLTFASLPYLRSAYNICYERLFGKHERRWVASVRPRAGEIEQGGGQRGRLGDEDNDDNDLEADDEDEFDDIVGWQVQIQLNMNAGNNNEDAARAAIAAVEAAADTDDEDSDSEEEEEEEDLPNQQEEQQQEQQQPQRQQHDQDEQHQQQQQQQQHHHHHRQRNQGGRAAGGAGREDIFSGSLADTILGALALPTISASMGSLLNAILPRSWTTPATSKVRPGLLQSKWGRSVVGGCLFVLFRDFIRLYCRWKIAQTHRKRRVLNYDRRLKRVVP